MDYMRSGGVFIVLFILAATSSNVDEDRAVGRGTLGETTSKVIVRGEGGEDIRLECDLGLVSPGGDTRRPNLIWSFMRHGIVVHSDLSAYCMENRTVNSSTEDDKAANEPFYNCKIYELREQQNDTNDFHLYSVLELKSVPLVEFGRYICDTGYADKGYQKFKVEEYVTLTRKFDKGTRSVTLDEGDELHLFCNQTGINAWHKVSWWKGNDNITADLQTGTGLFENFTKIDDLHYYGIAKLDLRDNYTCRIDLIEKYNQSAVNEHRSRPLYPVKLLFFVRVKEADRWTVPAYILGGEIAAIGLFTLIINMREKGENDADGDFDDSDDEDEDQNVTNGSINNNKNNGRN